MSSQLNEPIRVVDVSMVKAPFVVIVILNWNNWQDTLSCLRSLQMSSDQTIYDIIVCDNGSSDDSMQRIRECADNGLWELFEIDCNFTLNKNIIDAKRHNQRLFLINNEENLGFAGGNNVGIRFALKFLGPKYIWLLNNDTEVTNGALDTLVGAIEESESLGSAQSLLLNYFHPDKIDSAGIGLRCRGGAYDAFQGCSIETLPKDFPIIGCCAAAALYRSDVLQKVGLLNEEFFVVNEDVDLALRFYVHGYDAKLVQTSVVYHKRGISKKKKPKKLAFIAQSNKLYLMAFWWLRMAAFPWLLVGFIQILFLVTGNTQNGIKDWLRQIRRIFSVYFSGASSLDRRQLHDRWMDN